MKFEKKGQSYETVFGFDDLEINFVKNKGKINFMIIKNFKIKQC